MSSNEDSTTSESESTVRPKPFSKAPSEATSKEEEEEESKSSSSVASSDEENDEHVYYRSMPVLPDTSLFASPPDRRLDTVEELTEPLSSELFLESLGYDKLSSHTEEVYGTSEVEVSNPTRDVDAMKELENNEDDDDDDDEEEDETTNGDDEHSEVSLEKHELENDEKEDSVERIDVVLEERSDVSNTRVELTLLKKLEPLAPLWIMILGLMEEE
ncbi:Uncharacterized protein FKW44_005553 [Caligus rogercresseyi]|uniref:Uncharacterized protein n=1 Tax=Caligus rogercresseyi TaxID=217165 RepID=A0A7T8QS40_CALRO|nr:Uncharacterized protein FKW44_005553 [Caligus rogercresseyi]